MTYSLPLAPAAGEDFFDHPQAPWLTLAHLPGLGAVRWQAILDAFAEPLALLDMPTAALKQLLTPQGRQVVDAWQQRHLENEHLVNAQRALAESVRLGIDIVSWGDPDYPALLREIHGPPPVLYLQGQRELLSRPQLAIVGSRNATRAGLDHARQFARALAERNFVVTSGLALGVDGAAHQGALEGSGSTLAVLGTGVDVAYPASHQSLARAVIGQGALVSEFPPGTPPRAGHFPRRNRIISGMCQGTLVVEAGVKSGSLITARLALEQGREVFAIPGSIHNPLARGCHQLIRQGAKLVESVQDIEEELTAWWMQPSVPVQGGEIAAAPPVPEHLGELETRVLTALGYEPCSTDELCDQTGLAADQLMQSMLMLEMEGLVNAVPGGFQRAVAG
ncbi:DNA-processing protein DprA [Marinobacter sp. 1Y8]